MLILYNSQTMEEAATIEEQGTVVKIVENNISDYRKCIDKWRSDEHLQADACNIKRAVQYKLKLTEEIF